MKLALKIIGLAVLYLASTYFLIYQFGYSIGIVFGVFIIPRIVDIVTGRIKIDTKKYRS